jgi:hypothetical protein
MNEEKNIEERPEDGKPKNLEENPGENISPPESIEQTETEINKSGITTSDIQNMEVHHHPHVEKKNFKEYLLEGLMIFVAVTLGFFAEGIRENITDSTKENEYILSMMQDLRDDRNSIANTINQLTVITKDLDTMLMELKNGTPNVVTLNHIVSSRFWLYEGFSYNNRTVQQLKNAGNFRLLKNEAVADSILQYDNLINTFIISQWIDLKNTMYAYKDVEAKIISYQQLSNIESDRYSFNDSVFVGNDKNSLITNDRQTLSLYYNRLFIHASLMRLFISNLGYSKISAIRLMNFITKQYNLGNE